MTTDTEAMRADENMLIAEINRVHKEYVTYVPEIAIQEIWRAAQAALASQKAAVPYKVVEMLDGPCPICNGVEGCDHTVPERIRAVYCKMPEGYKLVPIKPTVEMVRAAGDETLKSYDFLDGSVYPAIYEAMLAAAPIPNKDNDQ